MAVMVPLAIAGMAMAAAGAAANYAQQKHQQKIAKGITKDAEKKTSRMQQEAQARWQQTAGDLTLDKQEAGLDAAAAERQKQYDAATVDASQSTDVMGAREATPQVVKTEAAKQLGDKLAAAKGQMAAQAKLGGWADMTKNNAYMINRSGEDVGRLANFMSGTSNAAASDAAQTASYKPAFSIGDALQLGGALMSAGAGGAGGGMGLATAAMSAAPTVMGAVQGAQGGSQMSPASYNPAWQNWWTRPIGLDKENYMFGPLQPGKKWT